LRGGQGGPHQDPGGLGGQGLGHLGEGLAGEVEEALEVGVGLGQGGHGALGLGLSSFGPLRLFLRRGGLLGSAEGGEEALEGRAQAVPAPLLLYQALPHQGGDRFVALGLGDSKGLAKLFEARLPLRQVEDCPVLLSL
jgi:hypothetical protein